MKASSQLSTTSLEAKVARQDDMIQDLVRLSRMQNSEINAILQQQTRQDKGIVVLNDQAAADANEGKASDPDLIAFLTAKVDALDGKLRDYKHLQQATEILQRQMGSLEAKIDSLRNQMRLNNKPNEANGVNTEELQSCTERNAKGQISMQYQVEKLADTLNRGNITSEQRSDIQHQQTVPGHEPKISNDMQMKLERNSTESAHRARSIPTEADTYGFASLNLNTPSHFSDSHPSGKELRDEFSFDNNHRQLASPDGKTNQEDCYSKDILNLKIRLSYAEKLIGARYRTGTFTIRGRSFFQDATALRYIATDQHARDTFKMFYGNRLHAIHYVDVAPPVVLAAFDIVARVRCRHEMWTDDKLEVKRQIRCAAEKIVDGWIKSLPLRESDEYGLDVLSRRLQKQFNLLKILCYRNSVEFDFVLPAV
ncbi:hypothetical protein UA08_01336 [Talaromyces atroroseus]|uniref:Uncharacterized protein n=1 Tax=Talaromyces atroroseus TaxID=1441469 RepID=A0A1Q5QBE7_TALAT|nr:hypothetical protein UA08_01336 [Talaromyces atroroseus]OKL63240.1 hypothetical protein UA08_01336 [Talaromyces atroroseus]